MQVKDPKLLPKDKERRPRRFSVCEKRSDANKEPIQGMRKLIKVRTPRLGRSKNIVLKAQEDMRKQSHVSRLNRYSKNLKKHKGPLSMSSSLQSIDES